MYIVLVCFLSFGIKILYSSILRFEWKNEELKNSTIKSPVKN